MKCNLSSVRLEDRRSFCLTILRLYNRHQVRTKIYRVWPTFMIRYLSIPFLLPLLWSILNRTTEHTFDFLCDVRTWESRGGDRTRHGTNLNCQLHHARKILAPSFIGYWKISWRKRGIGVSLLHPIWTAVTLRSSNPKVVRVAWTGLWLVKDYGTPPIIMPQWGDIFFPTFAVFMFAFQYVTKVTAHPRSNDDTA